MKRYRSQLNSHSSVLPQDFIIRTSTKEMTFLGGLLALKAGVDGIAISKNDKWIYYGAMAHDQAFRIETEHLKNTSLTRSELAEKVESIGKKPLNDGLSMDVAGNLYLTDVEHGSIIRMKRDGQLETVIQSDKIRWADALSFGPDNWVYIADSAIPDQMLRSKGHMNEQVPYHIFRYRNDVPGVAGQ